MKVLIETAVDDLHAVVIEAALQQRGHDVIRHFGSDFPRLETLSFSGAPDDAARCHWRADGFDLPLSEIDAVWWRRPTPPSLPDGIDAADQDFVWQQIRQADTARLHLLERAFWINRHDAARRADCKVLQLALAGDCGLHIPATLVGNDPDDIRRFLAAHPRCVFKPLSGATWSVDGRRLGTYTARVTREDLPSDRLLQACPGIFQAQVDKAFEVRAQLFGDSCLAIAIDSARLEYGEFDWRKQQTGAACSGALTLPAATHRACRELMRRLGIVAGAFDFIVTPAGEWIFLEVNEAGQFLFVERWCPALPVVDALCAFIESSDPDFRYVEPSRPQRAAALLADDRITRRLQLDRAPHRRSIVVPSIVEPPAGGSDPLIRPVGPSSRPVMGIPQGELQ